MNYCIRVMLYGMFCGVFGTALGGVIAVFIRKHTDRLMGFLLEFSAGLMVGVSVFNLLMIFHLLLLNRLSILKKKQKMRPS